MDPDGGTGMTEKLYSIYQVADLLGSTPASVVEWMQAGSLPCMRLPDGPVRISGHGLKLFMKSQGMNFDSLVARDGSEQGSYESVPRAPQQPAETEPEFFSPPPARAENDFNDFSPPVDLSDDEDFLTNPMPPTSRGYLAENPTQSEPIPTYKPAETPREQRQVIEEIETPAQVCETPANTAMLEVSDDCQARAAETILSWAVERRASHIHIEPDWDNLYLRMRIDGVLQDTRDLTESLPEGIGPGIIANLKALAGLDLEKRQPQVAEFSLAAGERDIECRLSTYPTLRGERLVIAVVDTSAESPKLDSLGLDREDELSLRRLLSESCGLVVVAGRPRSGRGTVLKAMVASLTAPDRNIISIENSPSLEPSGINQAVVEFTVADALFAAGSQDPDVVMVDEISDAQTASAAMNLALGGTLVLAGIHAPSGPGAIEGLIQFNLDRWALSKVLLAVVTPRTIRRLCENCRKIVPPPAPLLESLGLSAKDINFPIYEASGCPQCHHCGYDGRTALFNLIEINQTIATVIRKGGDASAVDRSALQAGMKSLAETAIQKLRDGVTSLDEIVRVIPHSAFIRTRD